jgi:threonine dehydratase
MAIDWKLAVENAAGRVAPHVRRTPILRAPALAQGAGTEVWLKLESDQVTGSFKARGGTNKLLSLDEAERSGGVVAASSGNHGAGVAHAAQQLGCPLTVFVPTTAAPTKVARIRGLGAQVQAHGEDCAQTEAHARRWAVERGQPYISPYNDLDVVAGQGTIAFELMDQLDGFEAVFVSIGGGGLISGIGSYLNAVRPGVEIVGCSPAQSPAMHACLAAGRIMDVPCYETLSDATAGGVEPGAVTFGLCQRVVRRSLLVDEAAIASAMNLNWRQERPHRFPARRRSPAVPW